MSDSDQQLSTQRTSQFNLRTLLMLFFCLAVGLTIGTNPSMEFESGFDFLTSLPSILHEIFLATASAAICIGLIQQALLLRQVGSTDVLDGKQKNMLRLAIGWRIAIVALLALCLLVEMLLVRGHLTLPDKDGFNMVFYGPVFPHYIRFACLLVVIGEYKNRLSPLARNVSPRLWMFVAIWTAVTLLVIIILISHLMVQYLVYIAIAGVEFYQSVHFLRLGAYPDHRADGFWFYWSSLIAFICLIVGTAIWFWFLSSQQKGSLTKLLARGLAIALLVFSWSYGIWYCSKGLTEISPEFAEAGFQSNLFDWIGSVTLLVIFITVGAVRLARGKFETFPLQTDVDLRQPVFHETLLIQFAFVVAAVFFGVSLLQDMFSPMWGPLSLADRISYVLTTIDFYVPVAICILSFQTFWLQWKFRYERPPFSMVEVDRKKFFIAWLSLALTIILGIPVIYAFCFSFWLGPWYLW